MASDDPDGRFAQALGSAAIDLWSDLPQGIQHRLFERAIFRGHKSERAESSRAIGSISPPSP